MSSSSVGPVRNEGVLQPMNVDVTQRSFLGQKWKSLVDTISSVWEGIKNHLGIISTTNLNELIVDYREDYLNGKGEDVINNTQRTSNGSLSSKQVQTYKPPVYGGY